MRSVPLDEAGLTALRAKVDASPDDVKPVRRLDSALANEKRYDEIVALWTRYLGRTPTEGVVAPGPARRDEGRSKLLLSSSGTSILQPSAEGRLTMVFTTRLSTGAVVEEVAQAESTAAIDSSGDSEGP